MSEIPRIDADIVVIGGGVAGLWLANLLDRRGYDVVLLEARVLGGGQTIASQGMIHGGLKYALSGRVTGASEAIAGMPGRWRRCLDGRGEVDLRGVRITSDRYYMWSNSTTLGRLGAFFASHVLRGRIRRLAPRDYPPAFADPGFTGTLYELDDLVLDTASLIDVLAAPIGERVVACAVEPAHLHTGADGGLRAITTPTLDVTGSHFVFAAGSGNGALAAALGTGFPQMQLRPLHQVVVRHHYPHPLYAHCITGITRTEPRLTVTTHESAAGRIFYLGGALATGGAERSENAQIAAARRELAEVLPWIPLEDARFETLRVDRAEPRTGGGHRPDEAYVGGRGNVSVCWPTKLSLTPDLGDKLLARLPPPRRGRAAAPRPARAVRRAPYPWDA